ncbi:unnamed protein product, partial [Polarella glacialis]
MGTAASQISPFQSPAFAAAPSASRPRQAATSSRTTLSSITSQPEQRARTSSSQTVAALGVATAIGIKQLASKKVLRKQKRGVISAVGRSASSTSRAPQAKPGEPVFASILSKQHDWRSAVAEIQAEASHLLRGRTKASWDFGVAYVSGYDDASVSDITAALDKVLGTDGSMLGAAVDGFSGLGTDGSTSRVLPGQGQGILLTAVHLPPRGGAQPSAGAKPFFIGSKEMLEVSHLVCRMQGRSRVQGANENANSRAWRQYLGVDPGDEMPRAMLLFVDPLASKYVVKTTLAALDLAFPQAVKFGGTCADLLPSRARLDVASRPRISEVDGDAPLEVDAGIAGILLPPELSIHTVVSSGSIRVGSELRVTSALGQVINKMQHADNKLDSPAAEVLATACQEASPLQRLLIERGGFLLGLEAPPDLDTDNSKVFDDAWGTSERAPAYAKLQRQAGGSDWLVRSLDLLPSGAVVVRREDLKRVPPRVGPAWLR